MANNCRPRRWPATQPLLKASSVGDFVHVGTMQPNFLANKPHPAKFEDMRSQVIVDRFLLS